MARPSCNRLSSVQSIHVYEWIKANWEKQVVSNKWTAEATAKRITGDLGFLCTEGNLRTVIDEFFPKYNFMHAAHNPTNPVHRLKQKADKFDELDKLMSGYDHDIVKLNEAVGDLRLKYNQLEQRFDRLCTEVHSLKGEIERAVKFIHSRITGAIDSTKSLDDRICKIEDGICRAVNQQS